MFQLLITVTLKSSVGAGVAIDQTIASFKSERLAEIAYQRLLMTDDQRRRAGSDIYIYHRRLVEKLYNPTK